MALCKHCGGEIGAYGGYSYCGDSCAFWSRVEITSGCWLWVGATNLEGYGTMTLKRKKFLAHRVSARLHFGDFAEALLVCHHCDNPPCVNPAHLFLGTHDDNMRDVRSKGRWRQPGPQSASVRYYYANQDYCLDRQRQYYKRKKLGATK